MFQNILDPGNGWYLRKRSWFLDPGSWQSLLSFLTNRSWTIPVHGKVTQNLAVELRDVAPAKTQVMSQQRKFFEKSLNRWAVSPWFWVPLFFFVSEKSWESWSHWLNKELPLYQHRDIVSRKRDLLRTRQCGMLSNLHEAWTWTSTSSHCSSDEVFCLHLKKSTKTRSNGKVQSSSQATKSHQRCAVMATFDLRGDEPNPSGTDTTSKDP